MAKKKGEKYECEDCGLVVVVENPCGCDESCELVCCGEPMKTAKPVTSQKQPIKQKK